MVNVVPCEPLLSIIDSLFVKVNCISLSDTCQYIDPFARVNLTHAGNLFYLPVYMNKSRTMTI